MCDDRRTAGYGCDVVEDRAEADKAARCCAETRPLIERRRVIAAHGRDGTVVHGPEMGADYFLAAGIRFVRNGIRCRPQGSGSTTWLPAW